MLFCAAQEEETEVDSHTMVKSGSEGAGTMRATGTMSDGAQTMIEHGSTMLESDLGTMVINSDEEEEEEDQGSMRSEWPMTHGRLVFHGVTFHFLRLLRVAIWILRDFASAGHATPQQPLRPSFMDYFDKQDSNKAAQQQENYNHNQPQEQPGYHIQSKNVFPDNWKVPQDGDFDFVSDVFCVWQNATQCYVGKETLNLVWFSVFLWAATRCLQSIWAANPKQKERTLYT